MRLFLTVLTLIALVACGETVPDDKLAEKTLPETETTVDPSTIDPAATDEETADAVKVVINNDNPTISDTQDFAALKKKESIESDKARLKAQKEKFVAIQPTALPSRKAGVNVAEYALTSKNKVGEKLYKRLNPLGSVMAKRNCERFKLPDDAQAAFLQGGGPARDPGNLDPDGDGFACAWSPETYRKLLQ